MAPPHVARVAPRLGWLGAQQDVARQALLAAEAGAGLAGLSWLVAATLMNSRRWVAGRARAMRSRGHRGAKRMGATTRAAPPAGGGKVRARASWSRHCAAAA